MNEHEFTLVLADIREMTDDVANALFEAGCGDGSPGSCDGVASVDFHRDGPSLEAAIQSAIADVARAGIAVERVTIEGGPAAREQGAHLAGAAGDK